MLRPLFSFAVLLLAAAGTPLAAQPAPSDPAPAQATPPDPALPTDVTLVLERGERPLLKLAFPAFRGLETISLAAREAVRGLEATVRNDLTEARIFEIQGPEALAAAPATGDLARDLEAYRSLGNELALLGTLAEEPGKLVFEGSVYDTKSGQAVLGKRYRGEARVARRIGHTFADEVILYFTGKRGLGLTSIAFHSDRTGDKEVFLMDFDGAEQRRVTGHRSVSLFPAFAPDGGSLAYVSFLQGAPGVYLADLNTGAKKPLLTDGRLNTSPSFSPDGRRLALSRLTDGNAEIFLADAGTGANLRRLTHSRAIDTNPAWSPSGAEIAFTSGRGGQPDIWVMDPEGTNLQRISPEGIGTYNDGAAWSPDGTRLAYAARREGVFQIVITDRVTLASQVLTGGPGDHESPSFSPDGRRIVYTHTRVGPRGRETQIWVMDADGKNPRQLTSEGNNYSPMWSGYAGP